jgi:uncharacterized Tic20 family protein
MAISLSTLVERARQGDARAIAHLITRSLADQGIVARGQWQGTQLYLALEAETPISQAQAVPHIRRGLRRLGLVCPVETVWVTGRRVGQGTTDWQESFGLDSLFIPEVVNPGTVNPGAMNPGAMNPGDVTSPEHPSERSQALSPSAPLSPAPGVEAAASPTDSNLPVQPEPRPAYLSDRMLVTLAYLTPLFSYLMVGTQWLGGWPLFWGGSFLLPWRVVVPLLLLLVKGAGAEAADLRQEAKAALNFQLTMVMAWLLTLALMFVLVGFLLVIPLALVEITSCIVGAVGAAEGKPARRQAAIRFVR